MNDAKICPIHKPGDELIFVALDHLRCFPEEIGDEFWPPRSKKKASSSSSKIGDAPSVRAPAPVPDKNYATSGVWSGRLHLHKNTNISEDTSV